VGEINIYQYEQVCGGENSVVCNVANATSRHYGRTYRRRENEDGSHDGV
jgi:hypothetical protein